MTLLPILWGEEPQSGDWRALGGAREALGIEELITPARALPGSPQPVLAIGGHPSWLTDYAHLPDLEDPKLVGEALSYCLDGEHPEQVAEVYATLLSEWMGGEVKFLHEEAYDGE